MSYFSESEIKINQGPYHPEYLVHPLLINQGFPGEIKYQIRGQTYQFRLKSGMEFDTYISKVLNQLRDSDAWFYCETVFRGMPEILAAVLDMDLFEGEDLSGFNELHQKYPSYFQVKWRTPTRRPLVERMHQLAFDLKAARIMNHPSLGGSKPEKYSNELPSLERFNELRLRGVTNASIRDLEAVLDPAVEIVLKNLNS